MYYDTARFNVLSGLYKCGKCMGLAMTWAFISVAFHGNNQPQAGYFSSADQSGVGPGQRSCADIPHWSADRYITVR